MGPNEDVRDSIVVAPNVVAPRLAMCDALRLHVLPLSSCPLSLTLIGLPAVPVLQQLPVVHSWWQMVQTHAVWPGSSPSAPCLHDGLASAPYVVDRLRLVQPEVLSLSPSLVQSRLAASGVQAPELSEELAKVSTPDQSTSTAAVGTVCPAQLDQTA